MDGGQYINTGLKANGTMKIEVDTSSTDEWSVFGGEGTGSTMFNLTGNKNGGNLSRSFRYGNQQENCYKNESTNQFFSPKDRATITFGKDVYINGNYQFSFSEQTFTGAYDLILFGRFHTSASLNDAGGVRIYYCKIWDNNVLVRDFIPVKQLPSGQVGLYDNVEDKFYPNNGSGTFSADGIPEVYGSTELPLLRY